VSVPRAEGTLILTFDVSGSMAATDVEPFAEDVEPTRMEVAKAVARTFVEERPPGVVIGLVAFSDAGLAVQVPTDDTAAVTRAIERLEPQLGTSLGQGILAALDTIIKAESDTPPEYYSDRAAAPTTAPAPVEPGSHSSAAMLVLSDGENNESPDPIEAAQAAAERGIRIHTVGVGSTAGTTLDLDGFTVHSQLQEDTLRAIAEVTDGTYRHAHDATGLTAVYGALARPVVAREEHIEVTALLAGAGVLLLVAGGVASLLVSGRLP
jgi:Ca-activated chloride channel family protein